MGYQCFTGDDNAPVLLVTNLEAGDTLAVCAEDLTVYAANLLEAITGTPWAPVALSVPDPETGDETDEPDDGAPAELPPPPPVPVPGEAAPADEPADEPEAVHATA